MASTDTAHVRNVSLVGHGSTGKTSLAEAMLHLKGVTSRLGTVDDGHSNLDFDPEEIKRKISISTSLANLTHNDCKINILDTPGYPDFLGDSIASILASEISIFVVDAQAGPQVVTDKLWYEASKVNCPKAVFINRTDKEHADFDSAVAKLKEKYGIHVAAVTIPVGQEADFKGVVDLIRMKARLVENGKESIVEIPDDMKDAAASARAELEEMVAEADDEMMMKYLDEGEFTQEEFEGLISSAIANGVLIPTYAGSATKEIGITCLLDDIVTFFPTPANHAPYTLADGETFEVAENGEATGFVFKTISDPFVGRLSFIKIISGSFVPNIDIINQRTGKKDRAAHIQTAVGKEFKDANLFPMGDIAVIPKLSDAKTGDTLSLTGKTAIGAIRFPEPLFRVAIEAENKNDEDKLGDFLAKNIESEPTISMLRDEETHQTVLSAVGDAQISILIGRLKERTGIVAKLVPLRIAYRETIRKKAEAQGRHKKQTGGSGQFGDCWLRVEPNTGNGYEFVDEIVGGRIPGNFIPAVDKGVRAAMEEGVLAGYPMVDIKVAVYDGSYHPVDSNEMAFKTAARIGFRAACEKASLVLLEPMASMVVTVDEEYAGTIMGDMPNRRGRVEGMETDDRGRTKVRVRVPYAEVTKYSTELRSMTRGTGEYTIALEGYEEVPADKAKKVVDEYLASREEK